mmetsp:Transcript_74493/g.155294  ORF Transcript_74493/g.155294 Transcript_74493/m.155294 type:complete len:94 (-) Transcript_74493:137-418(-)
MTTKLAESRAGKISPRPLAEGLEAREDTSKTQARHKQDTRQGKVQRVRQDKGRGEARGGDSVTWGWESGGLDFSIFESWCCKLTQSSVHQETE